MCAAPLPIRTIGFASACLLVHRSAPLRVVTSSIGSRSAHRTRQFAIARYHALRKTLGINKAPKKEARRARGKKAKEAAAKAKLAKTTKAAKPAAAAKAEPKKAEAKKP